MFNRKSKLIAEQLDTISFLKDEIRLYITETRKRARFIKNCHTDMIRKKAAILRLKNKLSIAESLVPVQDKDQLKSRYKNVQ